MASWVYIETEPGCYTVGHYSPDGRYHTDSDHSDKRKAADRVAYLNGHNPSLDQALNEGDGVYRP